MNRVGEGIPSRLLVASVRVNVALESYSLDDVPSWSVECADRESRTIAAIPGSLFAQISSHSDQCPRTRGF